MFAGSGFVVGSQFAATIAAIAAMLRVWMGGIELNEGNFLVLELGGADFCEVFDMEALAIDCDRAIVITKTLEVFFGHVVILRFVICIFR